jgi:hypothetical protein
MRLSNKIPLTPCFRQVKEGYPVLFLYDFLIFLFPAFIIITYYKKYVKYLRRFFPSKKKEGAARGRPPSGCLVGASPVVGLRIAQAVGAPEAVGETAYWSFLPGLAVARQFRHGFTIDAGDAFAIFR